MNTNNSNKKSLQEKISFVEKLVNHPEDSDYSSLLSSAREHIDELPYFPPYKMAAQIRSKYEEAHMIPSPEMQILLHVLEDQDINAIHTLLFLLPEKERRALWTDVQTAMTNPQIVQNSIQIMMREGVSFVDEVKSALIDRLDTPDASLFSQLKKWLPAIFISLSTVFTPAIGDKIVGNVWPDSDSQEICRLLREQNEIEKEKNRISREILSELQMRNQIEKAKLTDSSEPIRKATENTQLRQARTDNQMDISKTPLE